MHHIVWESQTLLPRLATLVSHPPHLYLVIHSLIRIFDDYHPPLRGGGLRITGVNFHWIWATGCCISASLRAGSACGRCSFQFS